MKKKISILFFLLIVFVMIYPSIYVKAEEGEKSESGSASPSFKIDTNHTFDGMECSYGDGYQPKVGDNTARVILPVTSTCELKGATISARADIDFTVESPFVCKNYEKDVPLKSHKTKDGTSVSSYLVDFTLALKTDRVNGNYPVTIRIQGIDSTGQMVSMENVVYVMINDGRNVETVTDGEADTSNAFQVDSLHRYTDMSTSYSKGYSPKVSQNTVQVILPLLANEVIKGDVITAKAVVDYSADCPFVCKNYEKVVSLKKNKVGGNSKIPGYLVTFDMKLKKNRKNGNYPITIHITAKDRKNQLVTFENIVYVAITDGTDANSATQTEEKAAALRIDTQNTYKGMNSSYAQGYRPAVSSNKAKIVLPLVAMNGDMKDNTIMAKATIDYSETSPFACNNYEKAVKKLAEGSYLVQFDLTLLEERKNGNYPVTISVNGMDANDNPISFETIVYVVIADGGADASKELKMQFDELQIPTELTVSDQVEAPIKAINLSKCKVYNVRATVEGDGILCKSTAYIGDMEPGTSMDASFAISITSLTGEKLYGKTTGNVSYTYEDETGKEYTIEKPFSTSIQSPFVEQQGKAKDNPNQWWFIMGVIAVVVLTIVSVSIILLIRKRSSESR